jgi:hypothetical protein
METYQKTITISRVYDHRLKDFPSELDKEMKGHIIASHSEGKGPFEFVDFHWTQDDLVRITCGPCLISPHVYQDGIRLQNRWIFSQLLVFDFDNKTEEKHVSLDGLLLLLKEDPFLSNHELSYFIHFSRNHDPQNGINKFHLFILLDRKVFDPDEYDLIYNYMLDTYFPGSDNIGERARAIIPGRQDYQSIFQEGQPLKVDDLLKMARRGIIRNQTRQIINELAIVKANNNKLEKATKPVYLPKETLVEFEDGRIASLDSLNPADCERFLCPCCGKDPHRGNPGRANATYQLNPQGMPIVFCSSCKANASGGTSLQGVYNISPKDAYTIVHERIKEKYDSYFFLGNKLSRIIIQLEEEPYSIDIDNVPIIAIDEIPEIKQPFLVELAQNNKATGKLRFNQEGSPTIDAPSYQWKGDVLVGLNPALRADKRDNAFIDAWLTQLFGPHTTFIRQWLAMYCYTNYVPLPVLILYSKERGTGKNVFAEAVCSIYEPLHSRDTDYQNFTEAFKGKLWYIDEQSTDGKKLYQAVKQIGGNNKLVVNNKYGLKHQVDRNLSVILTTNNLKPMEMEADELQLDETNNQFFVMEMKALPSRSRSFPQLIKERLGHYIRTELKDVYDAMQMNPDIDRCRYGMRVPVTEEERRLYNLSQTVLEREALEIWECLKVGTYAKSDVRQAEDAVEGRVEYRMKDDHYHVQPSMLRSMIKQMGLQSSANQILGFLQQQHKLGLQEVKSGSTRYGYQLLLAPKEEKILGTLDWAGRVKDPSEDVPE